MGENCQGNDLEQEEGAGKRDLDWKFIGNKVGNCYGLFTRQSMIWGNKNAQEWDTF